MKTNKLHIIKSTILLLLTVILLFSSAGIYYCSASPIPVKEKKAKKETGKEEQVSVGRTIEAVVVSTLNPDFAPAILGTTFEFSFLTNKPTILAKGIFISCNYFRTLFTHIISPNAP